jgi:uncharacterized protein
MPGVVLDSTCLIALEKIDQLNLLPGLFSQLHAPPAVADEFGSSLPWLTVTAVSNQFSVTVLRTQLDRGEAEALVLASELVAERVVLDDKKARRIAGTLELRVIGTVGIILRAKRAGIIEACRPVLEDLRRVGFHMSEALFVEALRLADEGG